ncbi:MarR family transcriptional regulator [Pseudaminobacter sp. 19-2017]|uniref:MarR family transcriptional regulator n=2 Tax=Pseudaminobacter soli (ex Zhang et al. 2022) TaxID=2831468 RepID=A0A942E3B3_9HYPH|nr:MarR family transcriptional regulator [Pseudaminobacter soli]MBS3650305.1 MarR family transcriptional regulator [Pseudaminobacter soli]
MLLMKSGGTIPLGILIHHAARLMQKRFELRAADYGLSSAQWRLLVRLIKDEGVAQKRLAELLEIEPISVSRLLDRMEEGGWIERRASSEDRRVRMVFATEKARGAFGKVKEVAGTIYDEALAGLSEAERKTLVHALETIVANLADGEPVCGAPGRDDATAARETN